MAVDNFGRIGVLMGGPSSERQISIKSGKAVLEALRESGIDAIAIDIQTENREENIRLLKGENLDCAFLALHGYFGEDGRIQAILEEINLPYTGSGVEASQLAMDKIASLRIFKANGLVVPRSFFLSREDYAVGASAYKNELGLPLVVKPANHGSSIGLSLVDKESDISKAVDLAFQYDSRVVLQEYIKGRELTIGVLAEKALPVIEIIPKSAYFDFEAKYQTGMTDYIVPAQLEPGIEKMVRQAGLIAHQALGCFACSRADIILSKDNLSYILEVNTIPGMTSTSLLPKAAKSAGISFNNLCIKLLKLAYEKTKV